MNERDRLEKRKKVKGIIEKIIILLSLWIIISSFFIKPLYSSYMKNLENIKLKSTLAKNDKESMTEEIYRKEIEGLIEKLEEMKNKIPDRFSEIEIYEAFVNFSKALDLELISVDFSTPKIFEDEVLKNKLEKTPQDNEEKVLIIAPDKKVLAHWFIEVKIKGSLEQESRFLEEIEKLPVFLMIKTINGMEVGENRNETVINLETYGLLDKELIKNRK